MPIQAPFLPAHLFNCRLEFILHRALWPSEPWLSERCLDGPRLQSYPAVPRHYVVPAD